MKYTYPFSRWARLLVLLLVELTSLAARAQNVGIGTTSPTQTLDVNGDLRVWAVAGSEDSRLLSVALLASGAGQVEGQELTIITAADYATAIDGTNH